MGLIWKCVDDAELGAHRRGAGRSAWPRCRCARWSRRARRMADAQQLDLRRRARASRRGCSAAWARARLPRRRRSLPRQARAALHRPLNAEPPCAKPTPQQTAERVRDAHVRRRPRRRRRWACEIDAVGPGRADDRDDGARRHAQRPRHLPRRPDRRRWPTPPSPSPATAYNELTVASGFAIDFLAPRAAGRRADRDAARGVARPAAPASTTSTVTQPARRARRDVPRPLVHAQGQAGRRRLMPPHDRIREETYMPVKSPAPGDLEPIETRQPRRDHGAAAAAPASDAAARLRQRAALPRRPSTPRACIPATCSTLADLAKFPFTTKQDLRDNYPFGMFAVPREQVVRIHASSGTTGKPTVVGYTRNDIDTWADLVARSIRAAGGRRRRHRARGLRLRPVHRRPGRALRRRARWAAP